MLLRDGTHIDVAHQFTNTDDQLCVYLEAREGGIDAKINLDAVVAIIKSEDAARALNVEDEFAGGDELVADGGIERKQLAHDGRPVGIVPDNSVDVVKFDAVECGDRVTDVDGTVVGHVIGTEVLEVRQHPDERHIEYVATDGTHARTEVFKSRQIPVCDRCGDIVLPDGGYVASHDDGCCNGGE